jgi:pyruvate/2-oxoacid:ferredoxin oxidoreductase beta subunit|tara:strand:- start:311 stop:502 length:192 start_codon:yes stop_codon:yes gene_type:complete
MTMITTKTTEYGSKLSVVDAPKKFDYSEFTIKQDGRFIATVTISDEGKAFICGHEVEIISDRA